MITLKATSTHGKYIACKQRIQRHWFVIISLWPSDGIWRQRTSSSLHQVLACHLMGFRSKWKIKSIQGMAAICSCVFSLLPETTRMPAFWDTPGIHIWDPNLIITVPADVLAGWHLCWAINSYHADYRVASRIHVVSFWAFFAMNSLWPSDAIQRHKSGSILAQIMAWRLTAPTATKPLPESTLTYH